MHDIAGVRFQIAGGRLFDVLNAGERRRLFVTEFPDHLEQVSDIRAAFVEIERIVPSRAGPHLHGHPIDTQDALDIPGEIVAVEFDFEVSQAVALDPLAERFRKVIADRFDHPCVIKRIESADEVIDRHARLGLAAHEP